MVSWSMREILNTCDIDIVCVGLDLDLDLDLDSVLSRFFIHMGA